MEQRTCNIIMCCKGNCALPGTEDATRLEAVAAYMGKECDYPPENYNGEMIEKIMANALCDYLDTADKPGADMHRLFDRPVIGREPSMSERIASVFALADVRDGNGKYVNGFTETLLKTSEKDLH